MWACPRCGHKFYNKNQSHSCGSYTINDFIKGKSKRSVELFEYFLSEYKKIGEMDIHPVKTRVTLLTKMRFCAINRIANEFIDGHLVLTEKLHASDCFYKIENFFNRFFVHHFRIYSKKDINSKLKEYMAMAYEIGNRAHVDKKSFSREDSNK